MKRVCFAIAALAITLASQATARADMFLTAAGTSGGFSLSTFADGFPNGGGVGPVGITYTNTGGVMISSYNNGKVAVFSSDTDGQHYSGAALSTTNWGGSNAAGLSRTSTGQIFMALQGSQSLVEVDQSGNFIRTVVGGIAAATGTATNPNNNHIFVSSAFGAPGIWDVNTVTNTKTLFENVIADGLTADANTLYAEVNGHIIGYRISDGAQVFDSGFINSVDGAVLGTGTLAGKLFANTNDGRLVEVDIATNSQTVLATGGSRGDLVSVDPFNGTLLLTQTDRVLRLTAPAGGGFTGAAPEPASMTLLGLGVAGLAGYGWRKRKTAAVAA